MVVTLRGTDKYHDRCLITQLRIDLSSSILKLDKSVSEEDINKGKSITNTPDNEDKGNCKY